MGMFESDGKAILVAFIGVIVAVSMLIGIANQATLETTTYSVTNTTVTAPGSATATDLTGRQLVGSGTATDTDGNTGINVTVREAKSSTTGLLTVQLYQNSTTNQTAFNVSYTYKPEGYVDTAGGRSITELIILFSALAILVWSFVVFYKTGALGKLMRSR